MIKRILSRASLSVLLLLCLIKLNAQEVNTTNVDHYQSSTDSLAKSGSHAAAYEGYNHLAVYYLGTSQVGDYLTAKKASIQALIALKRPGEAEEQTESFIEEIKGQYPDQYSFLSSGYKIQGDLEAIYKRNPAGGLLAYRQALAVLQEHAEQEQTAIAKIFVEIANVHFELNQADSATHYFLKSIELYRNEPEANAPDIALTYRQLGVINYFQGKVDQTLQYGTKAMNEIDINNDDHLDAFSQIYLLMGNIHKALNDYDSAFYYMNAAQDINLRTLAANDSRIAEAYQNLATIAIRRNNYAMAEEMLLLARDIAIQHPAKDRILLVYIYNVLGNVVKQSYNSNQQAIDYYNEAMALLGDSDDPRSLSIRCSITLNKASVYMMGAFSYERDMSPKLSADLKNIITQLEEAVDIAKNVLNMPPLRLSTFHQNLAAMHLINDDLEKAQIHYQKVVDLQKNSSNPIFSILGAAYGGLGAVRKALNDVEGFRKFSQLSEEYLGKVRSTESGELSRNYNTLANRYLDARQFSDAERVLNKAASTNRSLYSQDSTNASPEAVLNNFQHSRTLFMKARIMELKAEESRDTSQMKAALNHYRQLSSFVLETLREKRESKDIVDNSSLHHSAFHGYATTCYRLFRATGNQQYATEAFEASQLSRAILLKQALFNNNLKSFSAIPDELLKKENELEASIAYLNSQIKQERLAPEVLRAKDEQLFTTKQERNALMAEILREYPEYYDFKYATKQVSSDEISESFKPEENLLEYFLGNDILYAFVVNSQGLKIEEIKVGSKLDLLISSLNAGIQASDQAQYQKAARELYNIIFKPVKKHLTGHRVKVVPDGPLWNLNLDLLISDQTNTTPAKPSYLINEYAFSYAYSIASLVKQQPKPVKKGLAAFSFSEIEDIQPNVNTLRNAPIDLPGSSLEVFRLSQQFDGEFFYGKESTEARFKEMAQDFSVLHLALHGEIDEEDYDNSRLYFKADKTDSVEDNLLYPFELYNMNINANLVVLSACNSGSGTVTRGEGTMSLGRAFKYAGVNSLLLTKWEVSDGIAPEIISNFYTNMDAGMTKDEALRFAKLKFLETADNLTQNPFYWGSFFILGDAAPIKLRSGMNYTQIGIIFFLFILSAMIAFRIRIKKNKNTTG